MEMKTPKTAEAILKSKDIDNTGSRAVRDRYIVDAMEEYAEQARREERYRHSDLISIVNSLSENLFPSVRSHVINKLKLAGYNTEREEQNDKPK